MREASRVKLPWPSIRVIVLGMSMLAAMARIGVSQDSTHGPFWGERAHGHNLDMSCCAPCAPETNSDSDVCKRPCFTRAVRRALQSIGECDGLTDAASIRLRGDSIPEQEVRRFDALVGALLQPEYLPRAWDDVELVVPHWVRSVTELRDGARVLAGVEVVNAEGKGLRRGDAIQSAWRVNGIEVLPRVPYRPRRRSDAIIRLRLHGDNRIAIRPRVEQLSEPGARHQFFDHGALRAFLTSVFRFPPR